MTLIEALRTIFPPIRLTIEDHYGKYSLDSILDRADTYEKIVSQCDKVLDYHLFIQNWIKLHEIEPGDCWNISSICAHFLAWSGKKPYLFAYQAGYIVHHMECATYVGNGLYRFWYVIPYNWLGYFVFTASEPISIEFWEEAEKLYCHQHYGIGCDFYYLGLMVDGYDVRRQIDYVFPGYPGPVKLVNLEAVTQYLENRNYSDSS